MIAKSLKIYSFTEYVKYFNLTLVHWNFLSHVSDSLYFSTSSRSSELTLDLSQAQNDLSEPNKYLEPIPP